MSNNWYILGLSIKPYCGVRQKPTKVSIEILKYQNAQNLYIAKGMWKFYEGIDVLPNKAED